MATVTDAQGRDVSREQIIAALVEAGIDVSYARFIVALERGEIAGDLVLLDENDNEVRREATNVD